MPEDPSPEARLDVLQRELLSRTGRGAKYGLERMQAALEALDHPERGLPVVHVAGTNGKGSVCAMLTAIGQAAGLKTGTFTSPHLCRLAERIRLGPDPIDDEAFTEALERVLHPSIPEVTFFEAVTLAGLVAMRRAAVDLAIFEVGLGGRLDATNVVDQPLATAVVSVALDHTRILGSDLPTIAGEKAAIAKRGSPMVLGPMSVEARSAATEVARTAGADPVWWVSPDASPSEEASITFHDGDEGLSVTTPHGTIDGLTLGMAGGHQRANAAVAAGLAHLLGARGVIGDVEPALRRGLIEARWPGRLERIARGDVTVLLDCAHNPHAAEALARALADQPPESTRLVFGALGDKAWPQMLAILGPLAHQRYYCRPIEELAGRRPAPLEALAEAMPGRIVPDPRQALTLALSEAIAGETIVVAGSIFLAGAARATLLDIDEQPPIPL